MSEFGHIAGAITLHAGNVCRGHGNAAQTASLGVVQYAMSVTNWSRLSYKDEYTQLTATVFSGQF